MLIRVVTIQNTIMLVMVIVLDVYIITTINGVYVMVEHRVELV